MGDFAEDLINDFSHEFPDKEPQERGKNINREF